jgi:hypothetical protein
MPLFGRSKPQEPAPPKATWLVRVGHELVDQAKARYEQGDFQAAVALHCSCSPNC